MVADIARIRDFRDTAGSACTIEVGISTAFGCTVQGVVEPDEVLRLLQAALDAGAERVGLADTVGYADPLHVGYADPLHVGYADPLHVGYADPLHVGYADPLHFGRLFAQAGALAGDKLNCGHFHDTRGLGLANTMAAWATGISRFDTCLGGIGGCPHAPGASGNVATEDAAYLFASMGVATGVDFDALIAVRAQLAQWLDGEPLHGNIWRVGLPKTMFDLTTQ